MPFELNIQPKKRPDLKGVLRHDFRQYERDSLPKHIEPERQGCNRVLCGDPAALEDLSERLPETGRKIRKDANVAASMVMTLPQELDPDNPDQVEAWTDASLKWVTNSAPDGSPTACSTRMNHGHTRTPQSFPKTRKNTSATKSPSTEEKSSDASSILLQSPGAAGHCPKLRKDQGDKTASIHQRS